MREEPTVATIKQHLKSHSILKELGILAASAGTWIALNTDTVSATVVALYGPPAGIAIAILGIYLRKKTNTALENK